MKKEKKRDSYTIHFGKLFTIENGIGTVSDINYIIIKKKKFFGRPKFISYPGEKEVLVGCYELTSKDDDISFLINSKRLSDIIGYKNVSASFLTDFIMENNDKKLLVKKYGK